MHSLVQPNGWVAIKLPTGNIRVLQVAPNTTISLGKYGSFPSNLIIHRPYHLTYEVLDRSPSENFSRLRIVPAEELYSDVLASSASSNDISGSATEAATPAGAQLPENGEDGAAGSSSSSVEYKLVDPECGAVVASTDGAELFKAATIPTNTTTIATSSETIIPESSGPGRQTLTLQEIEALKKVGTDAGRDLIAKLMLSHTAMDQKTAYSLAKYKILKTRKYIRRFSVLPVDVPLLDHWLLEDKDPGRILDMREEMVALLGCWANVHFGGEDVSVSEDDAVRHPDERPEPSRLDENKQQKDEEVGEDVDGDIADDEDFAGTRSEYQGGRWLVVDDTTGLLVAAMAERMGILHAPEDADTSSETKTRDGVESPIFSVQENASSNRAKEPEAREEEVNGIETVATTEGTTANAKAGPQSREDDDVLLMQATAPTSSSTDHPQIQQQHLETDTAMTNKEREQQQQKHQQAITDDLQVPLSQANTITVIHHNAQPNLTFLRYFGFEQTTANHVPPSQLGRAHPLTTRLLALSWLQLLDPGADATYATPPPGAAGAEELRSWKPGKRGIYHRKRRRWARTRHAVDGARAGGFAGLVVASTMDPVSVLRHTVPLLAGGAPIAVYSRSVEPLTALADAYSVARRGAWVASPPAALAGRTPEEQERWEGSDEFPLNPSLVLGASVQTSRVRKWQVLPGRTHPLMTSKGGAEGYVFTGWRVKPAEGKVEARGKARTRKRKVEEVAS